MMMNEGSLEEDLNTVRRGGRSVPISEGYGERVGDREAYERVDRRDVRSTVDIPVSVTTSQPMERRIEEDEYERGPRRIDEVPVEPIPVRKPEYYYPVEERRLSDRELRKLEKKKHKKSKTSTLPSKLSGLALSPEEAYYPVTSREVPVTGYEGRDAQLLRKEVISPQAGIGERGLIDPTVRPERQLPPAADKISEVYLLSSTENKMFPGTRATSLYRNLNSAADFEQAGDEIRELGLHIAAGATRYRAAAEVEEDLTERTSSLPKRRRRKTVAGPAVTNALLMEDLGKELAEAGRDLMYIAPHGPIIGRGSLITQVVERVPVVFNLGKPPLTLPGDFTFIGEEIERMGKHLAQQAAGLGTEARLLPGPQQRDLVHSAEKIIEKAHYIALLGTKIKNITLTSPRLTTRFLNIVTPADFRQAGEEIILMSRTLAVGASKMRAKSRVKEEVARIRRPRDLSVLRSHSNINRTTSRLEEDSLDLARIGANLTLTGGIREEDELISIESERIFKGLMLVRKGTVLESPADFRMAANELTDVGKHIIMAAQQSYVTAEVHHGGVTGRAVDKRELKTWERGAALLRSYGDNIVDIGHRLSLHADDMITGITHQHRI